MTVDTARLLTTAVALCVACGAEAPARAASKGDTDPISEPVPAAPDTSAAASADSIAAVTLPAYDPAVAGTRPTLAPRPSATADSLFGLGAVDEFLLPPPGPALLYGRTDLRLAGETEWWETLRHVPGLFILEPGYPGVTSAVSFHAHGPNGTLQLYDGLPLEGGIAAVENANAIQKTPLAGVAVMRVGASHLYGPGAGGGAIAYLPIVQAPDRPYTEVTYLTGIFGQAGGSVTTALRSGRGGVVFGYGGTRAGPWSLFDGYRSERYSVRADWVLPGVRVTGAARVTDEKIKGILPLVKRSDEGVDGHLGLEFRLGDSGLGAVRAVSQTSLVRSDVEGSYAFRDLTRRGATALLRGRVAPSVRGGVYGGVFRDRFERRGGERTTYDGEETTAFVLTRATWESGVWRGDAAARLDRAYPRHDVWAVGGTLSRTLGTRSRAWVHAARTTDRSAYLHRTSDVEVQVNQGMDLPVPAGGEPPAGVTAALGILAASGTFRVDAAVVAESGDRLVDTTPDAIDDDFTVTEPTEVRLGTLESVGGWLSVDTRPVYLGGLLGHVALGASGYAGSKPDVTGLMIEPWQYGEARARLLKRLFKGHLRIEGEIAVRRLGAMPNPVQDIPAQSQWTGRITIRVQDLLLFYRSERFLGTTYRTSAFDEDLGFVNLTTQNVVFGLSWVLLD